MPMHFLTERSTSGSKRIIAALFEWSWVSVQNECPFLASAGYGFVQVSPPHEHITGDAWWTSYQVVSYELQSKRGSRDQFAAMVEACNAYGVRVIVDAVLNHMTGLDSGKSVTGRSFTHYSYPGTYSSSDFHYCPTRNHAIEDYNDENQVETCELLGLADLNTESDYVRGRLAQYLNDLLGLGVAGFRVDAAKHIAPDSLANIFSRLSTNAYITQEVTDTTGLFVTKHQNVGDVQVFNYPYTLRGAFLNTGIFNLGNINDRGWLASGSANVFVTNHDTERDGSSLSYKSGNNVYVLANVFMLSYPYGTPTVHSGFAFDNDQQGAPDGNYGTCTTNGPTNGWECQHRWTPIVGMVGFFNYVGSSPLTNVVTTSNNQQLAYGRGSSGHVVINNADSAWQITLTTGLADCSYCDVVSGPKSATGCSGAVITVKGGSFDVLVPPRQAIAIHAGASV
ncbi:glycoside hydrolase family 13 protein [Cantharellus anzutake]|uniref:glycoside hydrolase family 13 protein n=1 Tax=Cantharellus anzutake TaxID=1750568 RepID=UPI0019046009|nr:glycoside hydrolase family 13 protein [Cantharellus anzutake]KAF8339984.1 glycoside hydrolase family 13 protein [Cantharellus anzutake]